MTDFERLPKWAAAKPGDEIPVGQPYRVETGEGPTPASEYLSDEIVVVPESNDRWYVDATWNLPALELPVVPTWGIVVGAGGGGSNAAKWVLTDENTLTSDKGWRYRVDTVIGFVPLTEEQVALFGG